MLQTTVARDVWDHVREGEHALVIIVAIDGVVVDGVVGIQCIGEDGLLVAFDRNGLDVIEGTQVENALIICLHRELERRVAEEGL